MPGELGCSIRVDDTLAAVDHPLALAPDARDSGRVWEKKGKIYWQADHVTP